MAMIFLMDTPVKEIAGRILLRLEANYNTSYEIEPNGASNAAYIREEALRKKGNL